MPMFSFSYSILFRGVDKRFYELFHWLEKKFDDLYSAPQSDWSNLIFLLRRSSTWLLK